MSIIDICMCCDKNYIIPTKVAINSILKNTQYSHLLRFNILCDTIESLNKLKSELDYLANNYKTIINIDVFIPSKNLKEILNKIEKYCETNYVSNSEILTKNKYSKNIITNISNYSRFYFKYFFKYLDKIIYLDSDLLVVGDIYNLHCIHFQNKILKYSDNIQKPYFIAAPTSNTNNHFYNWLSPNSKLIKNFIKKDNFIFNAGVYLTELSKWEKYGIIDKIENYIKLNYSSKERLFYSGTQPPLNLVFYDYITLDKIWNYIPKKKEIPEKVIKKNKIIHFKGRSKPWLKNNNKMFKLYGKIWESYLF